MNVFQIAGPRYNHFDENHESVDSNVESPFVKSVEEELTNENLTNHKHLNPQPPLSLFSSLKQGTASITRSTDGNLYFTWKWH